MGQYPVTQKQWKAVASLDKVERDLKLDPSHFKEDDRPVECINWYDAVEFCQRLSRQTGKDYRLPSEAEWEYACRAISPLLEGEGQGVRSYPFYFGETITGDLANYNANYIYAEKAKGECPRETTPVRQFSPNAFGLYDMHGNVWEWCQDDWHENYQGAPTDGSAWLNKNDNCSQNMRPNVLRGGSWDNFPYFCRSAFRLSYLSHDYHYGPFGFRVVYAPK